MTLRELMIEWLTSSRYIRSLESRHITDRQDFTYRLGEKDGEIKRLRTELAGAKLECDQMRQVLMPLGSPVGQIYAQRYQPKAETRVMPEFDGPLDWYGELSKAMKEDDDGISGERREEVHQPAPNDVA